MKAILLDEAKKWLEENCENQYTRMAVFGIMQSMPTVDYQKTPNEPLTLEQLREMDGDKIAIHYIGDCAGFYEDEIAPYYGDQEQYIQRYNGMLRACDLPLKYYGTQWTATLYHRPPEGEE